MSIKISIDDHGTINDTIKAARSLRTQLNNRSAPLKRMRTYQRNRWIANITSEGSIYGGFAPLAPKTVKNRGGSAHPILQWGGKMLSWVGAETDKGNVSRDALTWNFSWSGSRDGSYAVLHSEGYPNTPARLVFDLNSDDETYDERMIEEWVDRLIKKFYS